MWDIWQDWLSLMAISISNAVEYHALQERNEEYARIISKYDKTDFDKFVELFTYLVMALESCNGVYKDLLGEIYHALKLNNENNGEFFTPMHIADFMANISFIDSEYDLASKGFISMSEPTCGSGVMVIAMANSIIQAGYDVSKSLIAVCTDINLICVKMAYVQLSLIGVPAVVIHGNSLSMEEWSRWYTPTHCWFNWLYYFTHGKVGRLLTEEEYRTKLIWDVLKEVCSSNECS